MNTSLKHSLLLCLAAGLIARPASGQTITIQSGDHERVGCPVSFQLGDEWKGRILTAHGAGMPVQVDENGMAKVIVTRMPKNSSMSFSLAPALPVFGSSGVDVVTEAAALQIIAKPYAIVAGRVTSLIATYQMQPGAVPAGMSEGFAHGAHLHPVFSPSGKLVTGNHPPDHPHQRGIWFAWTKTEFEGRHPDFWNMGKDKSGKLTGEVRFDKLLKNWSGPVHGGFVSAHRWIDHTGGAGKDVLNEKWELSVMHTVGLNDAAGSPLPQRFLMDLVSTQTCAGNEPVKLPKYHYGGLGVRGNALWDAVDKVQMLTSNGDDRIKGDGTKAKWVWLGGEVDDQTTGITVLIHPGNFRFPQPLRLNPKNPQLCVAPSADGDWSIEPGRPYVSRYRIVISDGKPDAQELERLWADYAEPPVVQISGGR